MKRLFLQSLFVAVLTGISGSSCAVWLDSHTPLLSLADELEQVLELEGESAEDFLYSGGPAGEDVDAGYTQTLIPAGAFHAAAVADTVLLPCFASLRQSQSNLLNSFRAPAFFILFHSYQGYLS